MAEKQTTRRRGGGGKLARSEQVSIRLDPKLRFAAELAASKERRTLSSFIEWAIERAVDEIVVTYGPDNERRTAAGIATAVWDVDAADRFVKLAAQFPELLTHDEQRRWKFIRETNEFWEQEVVVDDQGYGCAVPGSLVPHLRVIKLAWDLIEEHIQEGEEFAWGTFWTRLDEAYPKVQVNHEPDITRFKRALVSWAMRMLETETDPEKIAWLKKCRDELGGFGDGA